MNAPNVHKTLKLKLGDFDITPNNGFTRLNGIEKRNQLQTTVRLKSKKKLDFFARNSPKSYSLINLHKRLVGSLPTQSHGAEADCLTLLRTTAVLGMDWVQWVQDNCYLFTDCRKMWSYTKWWCIVNIVNNEIYEKLLQLKWSTRCVYLIPLLDASTWWVCLMRLLCASTLNVYLFHHLDVSTWCVYLMRQLDGFTWYLHTSTWCFHLMCPLDSFFWCIYLMRLLDASTWCV